MVGNLGQKTLKIVLMTVLAWLSVPSWAEGVSVRDLTIELTDWRQSVTLTGNVIPVTGAVLASSVGGMVTKTYVEAGQTVQAGDLLVDIYPYILQAQLDQAVAQLGLAKSVYERNERLLAKGTITQSEYDSSYYTYEADKASVLMAQAQLDQAKIRAPFAGTIGIVDVNEGDTISAGATLMALQQLDTMWIETDLPQNYLNMLAVGDPVMIYSNLTPDSIAYATVSQIDNYADPTMRTVKIRAWLDNHDHVFLPGMYVNAVYSIGEPTQAIIVPQQAVTSGFTGSYVYRIVDGKAVKTDIDIAFVLKDSIVVKSGLAAGDHIVVAGMQSLSDGAAVTVVR